ncbi:hypothetical protein ES708_33708 [subsurface metagenome]
MKHLLLPIIKNLIVKEKININTWKKPTKYKETCRICGKEFEFEDTPKERWITPKRYFCSDKCRQIHKDKLYQERLRVMPIKFRGIECDKKDLVKQGIEQSMFIAGASGVGKTVLMAGIVKEILRDKEKEVEWISYPGFIMELQSSFRSKDDGVTPFERAEEIASFPVNFTILHIPPILELTLSSICSSICCSEKLEVIRV